MSTYTVFQFQQFSLQNGQSLSFLVLYYIACTSAKCNGHPRLVIVIRFAVKSRISFIAVVFFHGSLLLLLHRNQCHGGGNLERQSGGNLERQITSTHTEIPAISFWACISYNPPFSNTFFNIEIKVAFKIFCPVILPSQPYQ